MSQLHLEICQKIADAALASAGELKLKPICVMILDARASLRLCVNQDGTSIHRHRIAHGKANGQGIYQYNGGAYYKGDWVDDIQHGNGEEV